MSDRDIHWQTARAAAVGTLAIIAISSAGCSGDLPGHAPTLLTTASVDNAAAEGKAVRATPVVPGRPARMYVATAFDAKCAPVALKSVTVRTPPLTGEVSFRPGQTTVVNESATGKCLGTSLAGTGVYYTAKAGASGRDRFAIDIVMADGATATRTFDVTITE